MKETGKRLWVLGILLVAFAMLFSLLPRGATDALLEYTRPTTVQYMPLPRECVSTTEPPPQELMHIVSSQETHYSLELQKVIVCRTARNLPQNAPYFSKETYAADLMKRWLPLYVGCCSYKYKRHVAIIAYSSDGRGSLFAEAVLIQKRWAYLLSNW